MLVYRHAYDDALRLVLQTDGEPVSLAPGETIDLPLSPDTFCLGFGRDGARHPCTKKATGRKQCSSCAKEDDFLVCLRCDGATCLQFTPALKDACFGGDYSVYLAAFGENVKAGISRTARLEKRWVEQGADYAAHVFSGVNGQTARQIESALFRAGYLPRVRLDEKMAMAPPQPGTLEDEFDQSHFQKIAEQYSQNAVSGPVVTDLSPHYPAVTAARPTARLEGTVLGAKGPVLFLEQNGENRVFGLPSAAGHKILENTLSAYF